MTHKDGHHAEKSSDDHDSLPDEVDSTSGQEELHEAHGKRGDGHEDRSKESRSVDSTDVREEGHAQRGVAVVALELMGTSYGT